VNGKESLSVNLGVFPTAAIAKAAMRKMEAAILRNPIFVRRGRDLRGLGQMSRKADEDAGTEGIYLIEAAHFHFMRLANVAICTTGLGLDDADPPSRPLMLMEQVIQAQRAEGDLWNTSLIVRARNLAGPATIPSELLAEGASGFSSVSSGERAVEHSGRGGGQSDERRWLPGAVPSRRAVQSNERGWKDNDASEGTARDPCPRPAHKSGLQPTDDRTAREGTKWHRDEQWPRAPKHVGPSGK